ncbi:MAG: hypothetical protein ACKVT1_05460 [Dehalococcoidia bacterium]
MTANYIRCPACHAVYVVGLLAGAEKPLDFREWAGLMRQLGDELELEADDRVREAAQAVGEAEALLRASDHRP